MISVLHKRPLLTETKNNKFGTYKNQHPYVKTFEQKGSKHPRLFSVNVHLKKIDH